MSSFSWSRTGRWILAYIHSITDHSKYIASMAVRICWFCLEHVLGGFASIKNAWWLFYAGDGSLLKDALLWGDGLWQMLLQAFVAFSFLNNKFYGSSCPSDVKIFMASACIYPLWSIVVDSHGNSQLVLSRAWILSHNR